MKYETPYPSPTQGDYIHARYNRQPLEFDSPKTPRNIALDVAEYCLAKEVEKGADALIAQISKNDHKPSSSLPPLPPKSDNHRPPDAWYDNI